MKKLDSSDSSTVLTSNVQQQQQHQQHQQNQPQRRRSTQQQQGHRTGRRETTTTTDTTNTLTSSRNRNRGRRKRSNNDHLFSSFSFEQLLLKYWNLYRRFVRNNHMHLELLDEGICRLLFWMPHHETTTTTTTTTNGTWREILFGLLSINRLLMDCSQYTKLINSYGTSVEIDQPNIPATSIRIALSVIHCLMPSLLGIMITTTTTSSNIIKDENDDESPNSIGGEGNTMIMSSSSIQQRQTYLRFCLEQVKFILRLCLLASYWKQYLEQQQQQQDGSDSSLSKASAISRSCIPIGILLDGGMFYDNQPQGLSEIERRNLERRFQYVGRRTGLKLPVEITTPRSSSTSSTTTTTTRTKQTIVAEILYALRPLYWAYNEYKHYHSLQQQDYDCDDVNERQVRRRPSLSLLKGWLTTLTMDIISLRLLSFSQHQQHQQNQTNNRQQHHHWSSKELKRRKMKLFLYLLRSPFWSHITSPMILTKASNLLRNYIPMVGGLIDTCLWDWILYHKQDYVSEEG